MTYPVPYQLNKRPQHTENLLRPAAAEGNGQDWRGGSVVRCLLGKHEDPSSDPHESWTWSSMCVTLLTGSSATGQSSSEGQFQVHRDKLSQKK